MNYLSNKLSKALNIPPFTNTKKSSSLTPSASSVEINLPDGTKKVVGSCHRQQYYKIKGYNEDSDGIVNIDWTLAAIMGDHMHNMLNKLIDDYGFPMGIQKLSSEHAIFNKELNFSGRSDIIAWDVSKNEPIGIEIKSIGEFKAKKAMEQPIEEHVIQSVIYLDFYNRNIIPGQKKITKWYIWYISRTENWSIKAKEHGSPFTMLWDFCIRLEKGVPIISLPNGVEQEWKDYSVENIYKRYDLLLSYIKTDTLPPRDYDIKYSEEKITGLYKQNKISKKTDIAYIESWIKKGAPEGKLKVEMGDSECMFCEYKKRCWENITNDKQKRFSNLPLDVDKNLPKTKGESTLDFL